MAGRQTKYDIVNAADQLFYEQGFEHTSFSQIAEAVGISRGNFYYHFQTKDEILETVIKQRLSRTKDMLNRWESEEETPGGRIRCFVSVLLTNQAKIERYGCPVGTLTNELFKLDHPKKSHSKKLFILFRKWLCKQFEQLGHGHNADDLAMHVLAFSQGVATLANAFQYKNFIPNEVNRLNEWLTSIENMQS